MRLAEVARRLAISRAAAYRLVTSGQLAGIRIGSSWRVLRVDFDTYLDRMHAEADRRYRHVRG
jgi:excisionase family DNA binding protein